MVDSEGMKRSEQVLIFFSGLVYPSDLLVQELCLCVYSHFFYFLGGKR